MRRHATVLPDLPGDLLQALRDAVRRAPTPDPLDHLLDEDPGEWSPAAQELLRAPCSPESK